MAVGRISGPLLQANLERNGINLNIKNTVSDTALLHFDATAQKLGINKTGTTDEIEVVGHTHVPEYIATTGGSIADFNFGNGNEITSFSPIILQAAQGGIINLSGLATDNIEIDNNEIKSYNTNSSIDFVPHGTGHTIVPTNLEVFANLHSNSNITFDGSITLGSDQDDDLVLNAELANNLSPGADATYKLGMPNKRMGQIHATTFNGTLINTGDVIAGTASFDLRVGNIFYVTKNGNDSNVGNSVQSPMLTIKAALAKADASIQGPVEIRVYAGEYEEVFPLEIPTNVSIVGQEMRNVIIKPTAGTNTNNCFLMNGETTVQNITVKDFFSPGHAFSFADDTIITSRSPYVQNVTVITAGSVTSASDPRGFDEGDAGKGALVDGSKIATVTFAINVFETSSNNIIKSNIAYVDASTISFYEKYIGWQFTDASVIYTVQDIDNDGGYIRFILDRNYSVTASDTITISGQSANKSMLFHSVTFITPGADGLSITNGGRVEWLNSFTYFANRGLYITDTTGGNPYAIITIVTGGSLGWEADAYTYAGQQNGKPSYTNTLGSGTKTIQWTGTYWELTNSLESESWRSTEDTLRPFQAKNWVENGFSNGTEPTFNSGPQQNFGGELRSIGSANIYGNFGAVSSGPESLMYLIQHNFAYIGAGKFKDNDPSRVIQSQETNKLAHGNIYYSSTDQVGNFRVGDEFFVDLESGETSIVITEAQINALNGISVTTNFETSTITGEEINTGNLFLRQNTIRSGPGTINIDASNGQINFLSNTTVTGKVDMTGNFTIGGSAIGFGNDANDTINFAQEFDQDIVPDISGAYSLGLPNKTWQKIWTSEVQSDDVLIRDNFITTTNTNENLELRASGTAGVRLEDIVANENILKTYTDDLTFITDANVEIISTGSVKLPVGTDAERVNSDSTGAPGIGSLRFSSTRNAFEGQTINAPVTFGGVFSANALTSVTADPTSNVLRFIAGGVANPLDSTNLVAEIGSEGLLSSRLNTEALRLDDNVISSFESNSDIQLDMHGSGSLIIDNTKIRDNILLNDTDGEFLFTTDDGWFKFNGSSGLVVPNGKTDERGTLNIPGDTRFNTSNDLKQLEVYAGTVDEDGNPIDWIAAVGGGESVTEEFMEDEVNIYSLILG